jgi:DNA-binding NtrC family response regulator
MTPALQKQRVLIVEDEAMIRMMLADMLADIGHDVAAEASTLDEARRCAEETEFDLAILDVNLNGEQIFPVVDIIGKRNLPFLLSTGYGANGLPEAYRSAPVLQKPFELDRLRDAINRLTVKKA